MERFCTAACCAHTFQADLCQGLAAESAVWLRLAELRQNLLLSYVQGHVEDWHDLAGGGQQRFSDGSIPTGQLQQASVQAALLIGTVCACQQLLNILQGPAGWLKL